MKIVPLRRHEAVHEPGQEDHLGRVPNGQADVHAAKQHRPAQPAEREADVEDGERGGEQQRIRLPNALRELSDVDVQRDADHEEEQEKWQDDRDDRPRLSKSASER
jgi:hypothetical protein